MIFKKDNLLFGIIMGLLAPILSLVVYYFMKFYPLFSVGDMFKALQEKNLLKGITILCLFLNVVIFTIYINVRKDKTAKGIFAITLVYAVASLLLRLFS
ncbi:MAG: hypothetical protein QM802_04185 [Agriterribacter sp.]